MSSPSAENRAVLSIVGFLLTAVLFTLPAPAAPYTDNFSNTNNLSTFNGLSVSVTNNVLTASRTELFADSGVNWQPNGNGVFSLNAGDNQFIFSLSTLRPVNNGSYLITAILRDSNGNFVGEMTVQSESNQTGFLNYDIASLAATAFPTAAQWFPRARILPTSSADAAFEFGSFGAVASASSTLSSGTMVIDGASALGSGTITLSNGAGLLFSANRTVTNGVTTAAGSSGKLEGGSGTTTTFQGGIAVDGTLTVTGPAATVFSGAVSGGGNLNKSGPGTLTLSATNTFSGTTTISNGTLAVNGQLSGATAVKNGGEITGTGTVAAVTIESGGTIAPGDSPGTLSITNGLTWNAGGNYDWEIFDINGGEGVGWDLIDVESGSLTFSGLSAGTPFNINIYSLSGTNPDAFGPLAGLAPNDSYTWKILQHHTAISGFNAANFNINASSFVNNVSSGLFTLELGDNDTSLNLVYTTGQAVPEPGTWLAALLLSGAAGWRYWRRGVKSSVQ
jgi:autotransporter-associated beta strand protein